MNTVDGEYHPGTWLSRALSTQQPVGTLRIATFTPVRTTYLVRFSFVPPENITEWTGKYLNCSLPNFSPEETSAPEQEGS